MKRIKWILGTTVIVLLLGSLSYWGLSIAKCEYLTNKHGDQFQYSIIASYVMFRTPDYFKVIDYTDTTAKVYYVSRGSGGDVVYFKRDCADDTWRFDNWVTIWSDSGSASDFIWPYIR